MQQQAQQQQQQQQAQQQQAELAQQQALLLRQQTIQDGAPRKQRTVNMYECLFPAAGASMRAATRRASTRKQA